MAECRRGLPRGRLEIGGRLGASLALMRRPLRLTRLETDCLGLFVLATTSPALGTATDYLGDGLDSASFVNAVATLLDAPRERVAAALDNEAALASAGLVRVESDATWFRYKLTFLAGLPDLLLGGFDSLEEILDGFFAPARQSLLGAADYGHVAAHYAHIAELLAATSRGRDRGCNVLVFGPPGTGKTELARAVAAERGLTLHEIASASADGSPMDAGDRFAAFQLAQRLLGRGPGSVILFDEVEDVLGGGADLLSLLGIGHGRAQGRNKAWTNRAIEENNVPAIWVANSIAGIDASFLRRFDYVLELGNPPRAVRRRLLERHAAPLGASADWLDRLSRNESLSPAVIERAARSVRRLGRRRREPVEVALARVLEGTLSALGHPGPVIPEAGTAGFRYSLDFVNADADLAGIATGLARSGRGRLCLYGPPGTGKTAFARHLAERLDRPLLVRRASDLLSPWLGETEQQLARMFREARDQGALLLLDEADSFLRERTGATHGFEVTQVNEVLVQMEAFEGLFVASTNLLGSLDAAALRRFDLKIEFQALGVEQALALLRELVPGEVTGEMLRLARARLAGLDGLTPGDFAAVMRRLGVTGRRPTTEALLAGLAAEARLKPGATRPIGFVA